MAKIGNKYKSVYLRRSPGGSPVGEMYSGTEVKAGEKKNGWTYVALEGWVRSDLIVSDALSPAPATPHTWHHPKYLLGISCLNDHNAGMEALSKGCRSVLFMDGLIAAIQAAKAYPDAVIFNRSWFQNAPDPVWLADHHGAGLRDVPDNLWSTCANECDWICYGTPEELRRRFEYERSFVQALWAKNPRRKVVIGEFSHGTPDINNEAIVRTYKETYYAFAQQNPDRVRIGWHLYTKGRRFGSHPQEVDGAPIAPEWYETRDASFWYQCGSDPRVRHMCGETGVESHQGGFAHANYSDQQFREWCSWWLETRRNQPVAMDAACLFQYGDHPNWRGYDVRRFAGVLEQFWRS